MSTQTQELNATGGERDTRTLLPLWRIQGALTLKTPLSIGSGRDEPITITEKDGQPHERHVIAVVRDDQKRPYIPASSLKGALNALACQTGLSQKLRETLFGCESQKDNTTQPAQVEFCNLMAVSETLPTSSELPNWRAKDHPHPHTANLPHVVIDRDYRTAEDKLLFLEQVVPPGTKFRFECTARALDESAIQALLGLLQLAGTKGTPLRLGGGKAANNGRFAWSVGEVRRLDNLSKFWAKLSVTNAPSSIDIWSDPYSQTQTNLSPTHCNLTGEQWLTLADLKLEFHTPFLVYQRQPKIEGVRTPDGKPRTNHKGKPVLPASSLHGALRAQAERILRTIGRKVEKGYLVPAVHNVGEASNKLDLAAMLFGAPGWRSLIRISNFTTQKGTKTLDHDMVAIDRLTGGGKDTAKFNIEALDYPTLTGSISLDLRRLGLLEQKSPGATAQIIGLLAHTLRDLDEGDIPLGYGAAKGYGRSHSECWKALDAALNKDNPAGIDTIGKALEAFANSRNHVGWISDSASTKTRNAGAAAEPTAPEEPQTPSSGDFHNPYVFIPFGEAQKDKWAKYGDIADPNKTHHSHARYAPNTFNGRLVCRLTTQTPIFIGAGDVPNTQDPKQKENFKLNGQIALPATSLRGMASSLHEPITRSALRVMDDRHYSVRANTAQALPKKGKIIRGTNESDWKVADAESGDEYLITPMVLNRLQALCDERTEDGDKHGKMLPKLDPPNIARNDNPARDGNKIRLVVGQIVYFDLEGSKLKEMAYSQIWRKRIETDAGDPWQTHNALPNAELAALHEGQRAFSPSELLFGCVEIKPTKAQQGQEKQTIQAFASKVHFGFGRALGNVGLLGEVTLKILSSPKPPSPAMYVQKRNGGAAYISKAALANNPGKSALKGRKAYLHALRSQDGGVQPLDDRGQKNGNCAPWITAHPGEYQNQKVRIRPIDVGKEFFFEVDFVNLSQSELESLCASLAPHSTYEHKLGMGKPIGLGSVKIDIVGMYRVDRSARYRQTDFAKDARYAQVWKPETLSLPSHLKCEQEAPHDLDSPNPVHLANAQMAELLGKDKALFNAILLTGNPKAVKKPVHYPQMAGLDIERENFKWFVNNDKPDSSRVGDKQWLDTLTDSSTSLPTLKRHTPPPA
ncbi:MAG: hypothetical protein KJ558_04550 [Gammaproteobacteria bacterium]|nr:hypothetical protein [Gammaproteobacteria bacterium]MBU1654091.1 hypothetical protein [Gammaproteobacteria bacterium]MBU1961372.1 hypothetical protein [Gammaproteobacteria bacterium]